MSFAKAKITVVFKDGSQEIIPCFKLLAPFIVDKIMRTQGPDISYCGFVPIENEEYNFLLHRQEHPVTYETGKFWDNPPETC